MAKKQPRYMINGKEYTLQGIRTLVKPYWKHFKVIQDAYDNGVLRIEKQMEKELGYPFELYCDDGCVGIGSYDRKIPLIHGDEL